MSIIKLTASNVGSLRWCNVLGLRRERWRPIFALASTVDCENSWSAKLSVQPELVVGVTLLSFTILLRLPLL